MTSWQVLIVLIFITLFFLFNYINGSALLLSLNLAYSKTFAFITGFICFFSLNELIYLPFMLSKGPYNILLIISVLFWLVFFCLSLLSLLKQGKLKALFHYKFKFNHFLLVLVLGLILIQTAIPTFFARFDGDDAFYIAISTSIQKTNTIFINNPSIGLNRFPFPSNYVLTAYEIIITTLSSLIHFDPVVVYHTLLPLIYIPIYFLVHYVFAQSIFKKPNERLLFVLFIALLSIFDAYSNFIASSFILLKSWMGKSVMIGICFPYFLTILVYLIKNYQKPNGSFFLITLVLIAGLSCSAVGLYLIPVYYFLFFLVFSVYLIKKINLKEWFLFIAKGALSALPSFLFILLYLFLVTSSGQIKQLNSFELERTWLREFYLVYGSSVASVLIYLGAFIFFFIQKKITLKLILGFTPILLLLTFLNPIFKPIVGTYLTSNPLYWRFFWLIPFSISIASFLVIYFRKPIKYKYLMLIPLLFIFNPINFALNQEKYYKVENCAKIPNKIATTTQTILENTKTNNPEELYLLALPEYNIYMRQYSGNFSLVMPRMNYVEEAFLLNNEKSNFEKIHNLFVYDDEEIITGFTPVFKVNDLKDLGITLVLTKEKRDELLKNYREIILDEDYLYISKNVFKKRNESN